MMKKPLLLLLLLYRFVSPAQPDPKQLNQYDPHHKKTGYWKIYFDDWLYMVDSADARYFGYDYYINGKMVMQCTGTVLRKKNFIRLEHEGQQPIKGQPIAIDGIFKTYDARGLSEELSYQNGYCRKVLSYFPGSQVVFEMIDYTQHYQGNLLSFRHQLRKFDGSIKYDDWVVPNEKGVLKWIKIQ